MQPWLPVPGYLLCAVTALSAGPACTLSATLQQIATLVSKPHLCIFSFVLTNWTGVFVSNRKSCALRLTVYLPCSVVAPFDHPGRRVHAIRFDI